SCNRRNLKWFVCFFVLSLTPKSPEHVEVLRNISTQFETSLWQPVSSEFIKAESAVHLFVPVNSSERVREKLRTHGITHEVLLANAEELVEMQTRNDSSDPRSSSTFYERYHSLEDIYLWINRTSQDNSASVKVLLLGSSYEKRPIYALKNRMWRKNRSVSQNGRCVGVDLNRNFDANWCTEGASSSPCSEIYCGRFPESEPESQAVSNFLRTQKDLVQIYISIHSYSQMLLFPYSCTTEQAPDHQELLEMVKEAAQRIRRHYRNNYKYGAGAETIYLAPGGSDDWAYNLGIKYSFTFELQDTGRYGFLLPPSHISKACNEALLAVKTIALKVLQNRAKIGPNQN
uniref:Peptidase M14 domain-containing protein n=1 Tax=Periophthalmus magnuspinnatus TaxID=409849 RepID=A0A3B4AGN9_9GOBI